MNYSWQFSNENIPLLVSPGKYAQICEGLEMQSCDCLTHRDVIDSKSHKSDWFKVARTRFVHHVPAFLSAGSLGLCTNVNFLGELSLERF